MNHITGEKICSIRSIKKPAVISMSSRNRTRSTSVLQMPSRQASTQRSSNVVTLQARPALETANAETEPENTSIVRSGYQALSYGVRMTLVALFALLGWPRPSRDNDPGPSAARPCHWEVIELISRLRIPSLKPAEAAGCSSQDPAGNLAIEEEAFARAA